MTLNTFVLDSDTQEIVDRIKEQAKDLSGKVVLITGGSGFLGRQYIEIFNKLNLFVLDEPVKVISLDNLISAGKAGREIPQYENIEFIEHDVIQPFMPDIKVDYIIHAAGIASPFYYRANPIKTLEVAIDGTKNMLNVAKEHNAKITFFSSSEIYGDPDPRHVPMQESYRGNVSTMGPRACYDESKRVGETLCYIYHEYFGVHTNIIRPFNVYGPGMQENDYRVLPNFASRIKSGMPLHIYGQGNQTRTFCYLTDAMVGFLLVNLKGVPGEVYNIGNPSPEISINDLVGVMEKSLGRKIPKDIIEYPDSYPTDEPMRRCPDIRKAKLQLKFQPEIDLQEGIGRFLNWAENIYIGEN